MTTWIRWFDEIGGGKNASLGEMRRALTPLGIRTPNGFAITADAYRAFLRAADLERVIESELRHLDVDQIDTLQAAGGRIRSAILAAELFLVQARPETVHTQRDPLVLERFQLETRGDVLARGRSVGEKIGQGPARIIRSAADLEQLQQSEVLVTEMTATGTSAMMTREWP